MSIGETLASERQEAGLTLSQVSAQTRIRETVIRGIEHDDFTACGGDFYARGHIRSICRVIGIDPEPLIREFDETHDGPPGPVSAAAAFEPETPVAFRERRTPNWTAAMAVMLAVVLVYIVVQVVGNRADKHPARSVARPSTAAPSRPAPPAKDGPVAMVPGKKVELRVMAVRQSWINVRDGQGKQLFSGLVREGAAKEWKARKKIRIVIGNGGGVKLVVNGKDLGAPGTDGQVLRMSFGPQDPEGA